MVEIAELDSVTEARRLHEIDQVARDSALALLIARLLLTVFSRIVSPVCFTISRPTTAAAPTAAESLTGSPAATPERL